MGKETTRFERGMIRILQFVLSTFIFLIIFALLILVIKVLAELFTACCILHESVKVILDKLLLSLIFIELITILFTYVRSHRVVVERIIEVGIISVVRELLVVLLEIDTRKIYALSVLLLTLGIVYAIERGLAILLYKVKRGEEKREKIV